MAAQMLGEVPALGAAPRRVGALLSAALEGVEADGTDWRRGVISWPEAVPGWEVLSDCDRGRVDHGLDTGAAPVGSVPFVIRTKTRCPRTTLEVLRDRAERQILAVTPAAVGNELWTGALSQDGPWTTPEVPYELANPRADSSTSTTGPWLNPHLTAAELLDPADHPAAAVAAVEAAAGDRIAGGPLFVHVPVEWVLALSQYGIRPDGNLLRTPLGSIVVADAGYPGTATPTGPATAYATGPVQVWMGDVDVLDDPAQIVDHRDNTVAVWAERPALVLFDQQTAVGCPIAGTP